MANQEDSALPPSRLSEVQEVTKAAAEAVAAVPTEAQPDLVGQVVGRLDTDQQKQQAEAAAAAAVPNEATADLVGQVVRQLDTSEQKQAAAAAAMGQLSPADQEAVAATTGALDRPDAITQRRLWYMVVGTMALAIFVFGIMAYQLLSSDRHAEAPLALATTALGGIVGLIATSPGRNTR